MLFHLRMLNPMPVIALTHARAETRIAIDKLMVSPRAKLISPRPPFIGDFGKYDIFGAESLFDKTRMISDFRVTSCPVTHQRVVAWLQHKL